MITYLQTEYFLAINEERNISKAAATLSIAPQTLSRSLDFIEKELGTRLFERSTPLTLTDSGKVFLDYARTTVEQRRKLDNAINDIKGNICGTIRLGISYNRGPILLPYTMARFQVKYPKIDFYIFEGRRAEIERAMLSGKVDLSIEHVPFEDPDIVYEEIMRDNLYLLVPRELIVSHYGSRSPAVIRDIISTGRIAPIADCPFLLNQRGNSIRAAVESIFEEEQLHPVIGMEVENMETCLNMCALGKGVTVYPGSFLSTKQLDEGRDDILLAKMKYARAQYTLGVAYRRKHYLTAASKYFIQVLKDQLCESIKHLNNQIDPPVIIEG